MKHGAEVPLPNQEILYTVCPWQTESGNSRDRIVKRISKTRRHISEERCADRLVRAGLISGLKAVYRINK